MKTQTCQRPHPSARAASLQATAVAVLLTAAVLALIANFAYLVAVGVKALVR